MSDIAKETLRLDGVARDIAEYVWKMLCLDWEETIDHMDMYDFQKEIRKML